MSGHSAFMPPMTWLGIDPSSIRANRGSGFCATLKLHPASAMLCKRIGRKNSQVHVRFTTRLAQQAVGLGNDSWQLRAIHTSHNWECNMVAPATIRNCSCATESAAHLVAVEFRFCHSSAADLRRRLTLHFSTQQRHHSHRSNIIFFAKVELPSYSFVAPSRTFVWRTGPHVSDTRLTIA